jgi:hypothetical protein
LFLYGPLSATLFYLPLNLIQAQHYSPTRAGARPLPMVLLMFLLSRWAGGLVEIRTAEAPRHQPSCNGRRLSFFSLFRGWGIVLDNILPGCTHVGIRDDRQRGTADDSCHEFSQPESCGRRIRNPTTPYRRQLRSWPIAVARQSFASFRIALPNQMKTAGVSPPETQQLEEQQKLLGAIKTDDPKNGVAIDGAFC